MLDISLIVDFTKSLLGLNEAYYERKTKCQKYVETIEYYCALNKGYFDILD